MTTTVQEATELLVPDVRREADWFAEPGQKQFIDPVSLGLVAMGLIKLFAAAAATAAGTEAGKLAVDYVRDLIAGRAKVAPAEVETEVAAARARLAALSPADAAARLGKAQETIADQCAQVMPRPRAVSFAGRIHAAAAALLQ
jgi:hypothetical protein